MAKLDNYLEHRFDWRLLTTLFIAVSFIALFPFWSRHLFLIHYDIGSDSTTAFWPFGELALRWIKNPSEWIPELGYGTPAIGLQGYGFLDPLTLFALALGKALHSVAYGHVFLWVFHAYVGCIAVYMLLKLQGVPRWVSGVFGLMYAYSSFMVGFGTWDAALNVTPTAYIPLILVAVEKYMRDGEWQWLPWPVALLSVSNCGPYIVYMAFVFVLIYIVHRLIYTGTTLSVQWLKTGLVIYAGLFLGVLFSAVTFLPFLNYGLESIMRAPGKTGGFEDHFGNYFLYIYRVLDYTAVTANSYSKLDGTSNFLEAPFLTSSVLMFVFLGKSIGAATTRQRLAYLFILLPTVLALAFQNFRYLFHVVAPYFRFISIFSILSLILIASRGVDKSRSSSMVSLFLLLLVPLYVLVCFQLQSLGLVVRWQFVMLWIVFLGLGVAAYGLPNRKTILVSLISVELIVSFYGVVIKDRQLIADSVSSPFVPNQWIYDHADIAPFIKKYDGPYRFATPGMYQTPYIELNLPSYVGYKGTQAYFSFNVKNPYLLMSKFGLPVANSFPSDKHIPDQLYGVLGVKYVVDETSSNRTFYTPLKSFSLLGTYPDFLTLNENHLWLPVGSRYEKYINEREFDTLSQEKKTLVMYDAVVLPNDAARLQHMPLATDLNVAMAMQHSMAMQKTAMQLDSVTADQITGHVLVDKPALLYFPIPLVAGWEAVVDDKPAELVPANVAFMGLMLEPGSHKVRIFFHTPYLRIGAVLSLLALFSYMMMLWLFRDSGKSTSLGSGVV